MSAAMSTPGFLSFGSMPYDDVYLEDGSSEEEEEEDENVVTAARKPLMSQRQRQKQRARGQGRGPKVALRQPPSKVGVHPLVKRRALRWCYGLVAVLFVGLLVFVLLRIVYDARRQLEEGGGDEEGDNYAYPGASFDISPGMTIQVWPGGVAQQRPASTANQHPTHEEPDAGPPKQPQPSGQGKPPPVPDVTKSKEKEKVKETEKEKVKETEKEEKVKEPVKEGKVKEKGKEEKTLVPCQDFDVEDVWVQNFPKLITETAFRLVDVNSDGVLDVIAGFSTGVTSYFADQYLLCDIYFNGTRPCFGGLLALDGVTGRQLWRHYADNEIFAVNCNVDIDGDGVKDCLGGGRAGAFELVSGATGHLIWKFESKELLVSISNFYTAQFIRDVNGDGINDVLNIHGGDPLRKPGEEATHFGLLVVLSGATGHVITSMVVPDHRESYYSPQVYYQHGGKAMVLFGTGGETHGGSLWVIALADLLRSDNTKAIAIYTDNYKGIMTPPVLADITGDGVVDIVMSMFNSTTAAFDGQSYKQLWNYTLPYSESYSTPGAAYYNDDDIPDFMITYSHGPGYPVYYYGQVTVLDGRNGQPILTPPIQTAGSSQVSPLTVSMEGYGNDALLYFTLDCLGHEGESTEFAFSKADDDKGIGQKSRSDFCMQRFNTKSFSKLSLLSREMEPPGQSIYNSIDRVSDEYKYKVNSSLLAEAYLTQHPYVLQRVKELIINGDHGDDHGDNRPDSGADHSQDKGDSDAAGRVDSDYEDDMDFMLGGDYDDYSKDLLKLPTKPHAKPAPQLGFDNEDLMPVPNLPLDSPPAGQPHQPSQVDSYPKRIDRPQEVDPEKSEAGADQPPASGTETEDDQGPGEEDVTLDDLLTKLLQDEDIGDLLRQRLDEAASRQDDEVAPAPPSQKQWRFGEESQGRQTGNTDFHDARRPGNSDGTSQDEVKRWLDEIYGKPPLGYHRAGRSSKKYYRARRNAKVAEERENQRDALPITRRLLELLKWSKGDHAVKTDPARKLTEYITGDLFLKFKERERLERRKEASQADDPGEPLTARFLVKGRKRRHQGPHDAGGVQRLISTGTLAPALVDQEGTIDLVFATYWFYPSDTQIILPEQQECIDSWMAKESQRLDPTSVFYGLDHDGYEHMATDKCTESSTAQQRRQMLDGMNPLDIYPFNIHTGELTVYRLRLKCRCANLASNERCAGILPYERQQWASYMGTDGNSHFPVRRDGA